MRHATTNNGPFNDGVTSRLWARVNKKGPDDCWPWFGGCGGYGYGYMSINGIMVQTHRIAFIVTNGPTTADVLHTCDNPPCCNPRHLFAGTHVDNMNDMVAKGKHNKQKIPPNGVILIRRAYASGAYTLQELAECFEVDKTTISKIVLRIIRKLVP